MDPELAGLISGEDIRDWWFKLVEAMGVDEVMFRRTLKSQFDPARHPGLASRIVALRPEIQRQLEASGLAQAVHRFDPDSFNPAIPLGGNLMFAAPVRDISADDLAGEQHFLAMIDDNDLTEQALTIATGVVQMLRETFGRDGIDHPLFQRLGMPDEVYIRLTDIVQKRAEAGDGALSDEDWALLMTVPFLLTAEQIGPSFPEAYKEKIVAIRKAKAPMLRDLASDMFIAVDEDTYLPRVSALENALYGRISNTAGSQGDEIEAVVSKVLAENGLRRPMAEIVYDLPTGLGGANLPPILQERVAFSRASIKRPDILILDNALASHDTESRAATRQRLRDLLPDTTMIFMEDSFASATNYDLFVEIKDGRIDGVTEAQRDTHDRLASSDLRAKQRLIAQTELFGGLNQRNQRLLAFSAQWFNAKAGQKIFNADEVADFIYLCLEGEAEMHWPERGIGDRPIASVGPGRVIGDLSIIMDEPRQLNLVSVGETRWLRIGADEFRAVVENDAEVTLSLLKTVSSHLVGAAELLRHAELDQIGNPDVALEDLTEEDLEE